jgi:hypothetical protein
VPTPVPVPTPVNMPTPVPVPTPVNVPTPVTIQTPAPAPTTVVSMLSNAYLATSCSSISIGCMLSEVENAVFVHLQDPMPAPTLQGCSALYRGLLMCSLHCCVQLRMWRVSPSWFDVHPAQQTGSKAVPLPTAAVLSHVNLTSVHCTAFLATGCWRGHSHARCGAAAYRLQHCTAYLHTDMYCFVLPFLPQVAGGGTPTPAVVQQPTVCYIVLPICTLTCTASYCLSCHKLLAGALPRLLWCSSLPSATLYCLSAH